MLVTEVETIKKIQKHSNKQSFGNNRVIFRVPVLNPFVSAMNTITQYRPTFMADFI